jgi:pyridoxamine 5'-phosphate oxidase
MTDPSNLRNDYRKGELVESAILLNAIHQFKIWFGEAAVIDVHEANTMILATANPAGIPSARVLLLKGVDNRGFTFYTNYTSRKARELDSNPRASMVFFWSELERQVRIDGTIEKVTREESETYFHSRPRESQIGAWASHQSGVIASREILEKRFAELNEKFGTGPIPLPDFWGGYRLLPNTIEFWQGRSSRLHDRILYTHQPDGSWKIERLEP